MMTITSGSSREAVCKLLDQVRCSFAATQGHPLPVLVRPVAGVRRNRRNAATAVAAFSYSAKATQNQAQKSELSPKPGCGGIREMCGSGSASFSYSSKAQAKKQLKPNRFGLPRNKRFSRVAAPLGRPEPSCSFVAWHHLDRAAPFYSRQAQRQGREFDPRARRPLS